MVPGQALAPGDAERVAPVGRGVRHRRDRERRDVRAAGTQRAAQEQEEQRVGDRRQDADEEEPGDRAVGGEPRDAAQVVPRGPHDVHARVGVVDPVHGDLVDAQAAPLGEHEQLGVEEPAVVVHVVDEAAQRAGAHRLEAALRIAEAGAQGRVEDGVVRTGDELTLGAADHPCAVREAGADGEIGVPRQQRGDERHQAAQVRREVDVHVADDLRRAGGPGGAQRAAAALLLEAQHLHAAQLASHPARDLRRVVDARVVGDDDPPGEGQLGGEEPVQAPDRVLEDRLLVVHGDDDVDLGGLLGRRGHGTQDGRSVDGACVLSVHASRIGSPRRRRVGIG